MREIITLFVCIVIFLIALQSGLIRTGLDYEMVQKTNENLQSSNEHLTQELKRVNHLEAAGQTGNAVSAGQVAKLEQLEQAAIALKTRLARELKTREIVLEASGDNVKLVLLSKALFEGQTDRLKPEAQEVLAKIAKPLADLTQLEIRISGYTDNQVLSPSASRKFPDLHYLSAARALAILDFFQAKGQIDPVQMAAAGYGESRPLVPNDSEYHRTLNGRIEISLYSVDPELLAKAREIFRTESLLAKKIGSHESKPKKNSEESQTTEPIGEESLNQGDTSNFGAGYEVPEASK